MPQPLVPFSVTVVAIVGTVVAWAALTAKPIGTGSTVPMLSLAPAPSGVAYLEPGSGIARLRVQDVLAGEAPVTVASFAYRFSFQPRGSVSPHGDRAAILGVADQPASLAFLSLVSLPGGERIDLPRGFDYLSPIAWAPAGDRLALVRTDAVGGGKTASAVIEVEAATGSAQEVASFPSALEVAPVGYSHDGERLFVVVVDSSGSALWAVRGAQVERLAMFSPGATRDWKLSPDGSRLAFVDRLGVGERRYAGRTLLIATGTVTRAAGEADQLGASWRPGSALPDFGGPGGTVRLTDDAGAAYLVPVSWSPDGETLAAAVYRQDGSSSAAEAVELVTPHGRLPISDVPGVRFLGWAQTPVSPAKGVTP